MPVPRPRSLLLLLALLTPGQAEDYQSWCQAWFTPAEHLAGFAAPLADPDQDALNNLGEYLAGTSPHSAQPPLSPTLEMSAGNTATAAFNLAPGTSDVGVTAQVSHDLLTWHEHALPLLGASVSTFDLNGYPFIRLAIKPTPGSFFDTDGDGLEDFFEGALIRSNPTDALHTLADVLPDDDFDTNGTINIDEAQNSPASSGNSRPPLLDPATISASLDATAPSPPTALLLHTPLR